MRLRRRLAATRFAYHLLLVDFGHHGPHGIPDLQGGVGGQYRVAVIVDDNLFPLLSRKGLPWWPLCPPCLFGDRRKML